MGSFKDVRHDANAHFVLGQEEDERDERDAAGRRSGTVISDERPGDAARERKLVDAQHEEGAVAQGDIDAIRPRWMPLVEIYLRCLALPGLEKVTRPSGQFQL